MIKNQKSQKDNDYLTRGKIAQLVYLHRPQKGKEYAHHIAKSICKSAHNNNIDPYWVATTACIESEFDMKSRPCIGIMQVDRATWKNNYPDMDVLDIDQNIEIGANDLARKYYKLPERSQRRNINLASRGTTTSRNSRSYSVRRMWARYNGSGENGFYVKRALKVNARIQKESSEQLKIRMKTKGSIWRN